MTEIKTLKGNSECTFDATNIHYQHFQPRTDDLSVYRGLVGRSPGTVQNRFHVSSRTILKSRYLSLYSIIFCASVSYNLVYFVMTYCIPLVIMAICYLQVSTQQHKYLHVSHKYLQISTHIISSDGSQALGPEAHWRGHAQPRQVQENQAEGGSVVSGLYECSLLNLPNADC